VDEAGGTETEPSGREAEGATADETEGSHEADRSAEAGSSEPGEETAGGQTETGERATGSDDPGTDEHAATDTAEGADHEPETTTGTAEEATGGTDAGESGADAASGRGGDGATGAESASADGDAGRDSSGRRTETNVSALEYNKVMRLLQNREFPIERSEIVGVAASAYELSESDCAAVIDLAVDRGLIDERNGQLVRPED
jgi:hypothetical protein